MKWPAGCRRTTFVAVAGGIAAGAILVGGTAVAAVPASAAAAAITTSTTLHAPDDKQAEVTLTESPAGNGKYNDAVSFSQVSAGIIDEVLAGNADNSVLETSTGAVTLYLAGVSTVRAAICDSSGCSPWWP